MLSWFGWKGHLGHKLDLLPLDLFKRLFELDVVSQIVLHDLRQVLDAEVRRREALTFVSEPLLEHADQLQHRFFVLLVVRIDSVPFYLRFERAQAIHEAVLEEIAPGLQI